MRLRIEFNFAQERGIIALYLIKDCEMRMKFLTWQLKEQIKKIAAQEEYLEKFNYHKPFKVAFLYPNVYEVGMSNLGLHILYTLLNREPQIACERFFLPDRKIISEYQKTKSSIYSIETQKRLQEFDIIGVSMSFEADYFNLLTMLSLSKIKLRAQERGEQDPFILVGGPCATFNPEPLAVVADAFIIGEGEVTLIKAVNCLLAAEHLTRSAKLSLLAQIPGVYVPSLRNKINQGEQSTGEKSIQAVRISRQIVTDLANYPNHSIIITQQTEFAKMLIVEISRGCGRHCRFCMAGYAFRYPRHRSLEQVQKAINDYGDRAEKIGLMGPAVSDYPDILPLAEYILNKNLNFSVASLRADSLTPQLVDHLAQSGQRTLTIAPEAGSQRLRDIINKGITETDIYSSIKLLALAKIPNLKLYLMLGLPLETMEDIEELIIMVKNLRQEMNAVQAYGNLILSINTFIPKPATPFQWQPLASKREIENKLKLINNALKPIRGVIINVESYKESVVQAILARGDRQVGEYLLQAHELGGSKYFLQVVKAATYDLQKQLYTIKDFAESLPWDNLDMGFSKDYLKQEFERAKSGKFTIPCLAKCRRCGVCKDGSEVQ